jgi:hypothetical protein
MGSELPCRQCSDTTGVQVTSNGVDAALAGADTHQIMHGNRPDLAIPDPSGLGGLEDDVDDTCGVDVVGQNLQTHLRHEVDGVLGASVDLAVALLATEARASLTVSSWWGLMMAVTSFMRSLLP